MKWYLPLAILLVFSSSALASEQIRKAQTELKEEGFYFGEVTGESSSEFSAALRRYQIRNGLEVSGELNAETLEALGMQGAAPVQPLAPKKPVQATPPAPPAVQKKPPVHLRKDDDVMESDREFLESDTRPQPGGISRVLPPSDPSIVRRPAPLDDQPVAIPGAEFAEIFQGTPYETAPREVQDQTLRKAQALLARRGFYRERIDGDPGPATEEAILTYQRSVGLPLSGSLDLRTLSALRLLPGRPAGNAPLKPFRSPGRSQSGGSREIWIQ